MLALASGIGTTIFVTVFSFVLGAFLALPLTWARVSGIAPLKVLATAIVEVFRGVPIIVWLLLMYLSVVIGPWRPDPLTTSVVVFSFLSAVYLSEIYRSSLMAIPRGQWEAAHALALPQMVGFARIIVPQAIPLVIPAAATFAIGLLKDAAIGSIIGTKDVTFYAQEWAKVNGGPITVFAAAAAIYLVLSIPIAIVARRSGDALRKRVMG
ncbi:amino acid ABC transporter permease [Brevibacterium samyangense]|uniref:Amino acid ABC transporter permease n=1 Tax=Brevibacterium samyangense TaxID=366888 RepID=A0ABN2TBL0_9MICO